MHNPVNYTWRQICTQNLHVWGNVVTSQCVSPALSFRTKHIMTSWSCQECDVTIGSSVMALCFVHLKWRYNWAFIIDKRRGRKIINNHIAEGTRESYPRVHDMQRPSIVVDMRIKNDLEFQIERYQSRATCLDIILTEVLAEIWMSKHVARAGTRGHSWFFFSLNIDNKIKFCYHFYWFWHLTHLYAIHTLD